MPLQRNFELKCEQYAPFTIFRKFDAVPCREGGISYDIHVGMHDFEVALVNAINHAGHRVKYKGIYAIDNTPWGEPW